MIPFQTMSITDFVNTTFPCDCGREHRMDMDRIVVSQRAIQEIPGLMAQYGYTKAYLIADENTWKAAGQTVEACIPGERPCLSALYLSGGERGA